MREAAAGVDEAEGKEMGESARGRPVIGEMVIPSCGGGGVVVVVAGGVVVVVAGGAVIFVVGLMGQLLSIRYHNCSLLLCHETREIILILTPVFLNKSEKRGNIVHIENTFP